jgi:hypothetical protein
VQRVEAGEEIIELEEAVGGDGEPMRDLLRILGRLHAKEDEAQGGGECQPAARRAHIAGVACLDRERCEQAAGQQHEGVEHAEPPVELRLTGAEQGGLAGVGGREGDEEAAEREQLARDQHPHHQVARQAGAGGCRRAATAGQAASFRQRSRHIASASACASPRSRARPRTRIAMAAVPVTAASTAGSRTCPPQISASRSGWRGSVRHG